jgi:biopolymer transport protein TolQ
MYVNTILLTGNAFIEAYSQSDLLGKFIFLALYLLSIWSWTILVHKIWITYQAKKQSAHFYEIFQLQKLNPLGLECENIPAHKNNPFLDIYRIVKKQCIEIFAKKEKVRIQKEETESNFSALLSVYDIESIASNLAIQIGQQIKSLEKNLYILSTTVSLAPFLGLLGTVWGILTTFAELQSGGAGSSHQMVLSGLSLALATTVLGLLDAIPALIGYNYLKNTIRDFSIEMEGFSNEILIAIEKQYSHAP